MRRTISSLAALVLFFGGIELVSAAPIFNGDFEQGGGSLAGWTVMIQPGSFMPGTWWLQSGTTSPVNAFLVPSPPGPTHAAMTDSQGFGTQLLYQDFIVPTAISAATLSFDRYIQNIAGGFDSPNSLDYRIRFNQQVRVDILTAVADPFSVAPGDVLMNLFQTHPGDPSVSGYTTQINDLTALLQTHEGQTLRLRFAEASNRMPLLFGVDRINLNVTSVPEPSALALLAIGILRLALYRWRVTS